MAGRIVTTSSNIRKEAEEIMLLIREDLLNNQTSPEIENIISLLKGDTKLSEDELAVFNNKFNLYIDSFLNSELFSEQEQIVQMMKTMVSSITKNKPPPEKDLLQMEMVLRKNSALILSEVEKIPPNSEIPTVEKIVEMTNKILKL